uniref:Lipoprotein n=1 Tax=Caenorhabditis japonica TaxID=281687 RepID=A0A8R1HPB1_CAEJA
MNFIKTFISLFLVLTIILSGCESNTLRDMITKTIKKRQETTGGMQENYTKLLPPHVAEMFLRRHFRR